MSRAGPAIRWGDTVHRRTFHVAPTPPERLGRARPDAYPDIERFHRVLAWTLQRREALPRQ